MPYARLVSPTTQIVLFSATFPEKVRIFANKFAPTADEIKLKQEELSVEGIRQLFMDCKDEQKKYDVLVQLYNILTIGQSIIFCKVGGLDFGLHGNHELKHTASRIRNGTPRMLSLSG